MESQSLGAIMKKFLLNLYEKSQKLTFMQGVVLTITLTSLVSIASTVLPNGLFSFSPGTPISSSEINENFKKVAGEVVLKVTYDPITFTNASYGTSSNCTDPLTCHNYNKKVKFQKLTFSDANFLEATISSPDTTPASQTFNYYKVPESGWYEVRFTPFASSFQLADPSCATATNSCSFGFSMNSSLQLADNLAAIDGMGMIHIASKNLSINRQNYDANLNALDAPSMMGGAMLLESKRIYLTTGQIIYATFSSSYNANSMVDDTLNASFGGMELTILKL